LKDTSSPISSPPKNIAMTPNLNWDGQRILIAEDEEDNYELVKIFLRKLNIQLIHAWDGEQALALCQQNPDLALILMDIRMPIMDGYETTRRIRETDKNIPIIALTAHALEEERRLCLEAGCNDFLRKPVSREQLSAILAQYLKARKP
jgi:CheY-like chemotaxis protein